MGLVVVSGRREGHQHGGPARDGQLRQRGGAAAAHDQIGLLERLRHAADERLDLVVGRVEPGGSVRFGDRPQIGLTGLVRDPQRTPAG